MSRPGDRLRALAARVFDARTMERVVDPLVADLQAEYGAAVRARRLWRSRVIWIAGYGALAKVIAMSGWTGAMHAHLDWTADDRRTLVRVIGFSIVPVVAITILLELPPLMQSLGLDSAGAHVLLTLIPQALAIAVPVGVLLGTLFGLRGRDSSRRLRSSLVLLAVMCSAGSFANLAWILPGANHAFRVHVATRLGDDPQTVQKGPNELTLDELRRLIQSMRNGANADPRYLGQLEGSYYSRWALTFAPLVLALLALAIVRRRSAGRLMLSAAACAACFGYYVLLYWARASGVSGETPAVLAAWLPNVGIALAAMLVTLRSRSTKPARQA